VGKLKLVDKGKIELSNLKRANIITTEVINQLKDIEKGLPLL